MPLPATVPPPRAPVLRMPAGSRLLVLDDDACIGTTVQVIAESVGAQAELHTEPQSFFDALERFTPTHLCVDLNMPAMDGLQVLGELARRRCRAQVIVSSGVGQRVLEAAGRSGQEQGLSVLGVLHKPFLPDELLALLARAPAPGAPGRDAAAAAALWTPNRADLKAALARRELCVHYQPKVDCHDGSLRGLEALVRWQHPRHGLVPPDRFVPLAEEAGQIDALTLQVLEQALAWFVPWTRADLGRQGLKLAINLSAASLDSPDFVPQLLACCRAAGAAPRQLVFELTETATMSNPTLALALLTRLRVQGFELSIDDFGTAYSSLLQLRRLPFSEMKVDRSFVREVRDSADARALVRTIVNLGHDLELSVTAEGVEDAEALQYLRDVGCDLAQGYHIGRPMPAAALQGWWTARAAEAQRPGVAAAGGDTASSVR